MGLRDDRNAGGLRKELSRSWADVTSLGSRSHSHQPSQEEVILPAGLLKFRLRYYALVTARLLLRRWQAIALLLGVLATANASLFNNLEMFTYPLLAWLEGGHGILWRLLYLFVVQGVAAFWVLMQRDQIDGGDFMRLVRSLPFSRRQLRQVDTVVLLVADSPLLLLVGGALILMTARADSAAHLLAMCDTVLLVLVAQLGVLERRPNVWLGVSAGCILLAGGIGSRFALPASVLACVLTCLMLRIGLLHTGKQGLRLRAPAPTWPARLLRACAGRHYAPLSVSLGILYRQRRYEALGKAFSASCIAGAALALMGIFDHDGRVLGLDIMASALIVLNTSGLHRILHMEHASSAGYVGALPLPKNCWRWFDFIAVATCAFPFLAGLAIVPWLNGAETGARALANLLSCLALLGLLRLPQLASERHAVFFSTTVAACWAALTIGLLN